MNKDIEKKLNSIKVNELTAQESDQVWRSIAKRLEMPQQGFSYILLLKPKFMIGIIMAILLVVGGGLTVQAADSAKPGDFLFPLDQAVEKVQLTIAGKEKKQELKLKFAEERVEELSEIIAEVREDDDRSGSNGSSSGDTATSTPVASSTPVSTSTSTTTPAVGRSDDRLEKALSFAIEYLSQVKAELQNSSDAEAALKLNELMDRLGNDLLNLPPGTKNEIKFQSEDGKVEFELETKDKGEQKVELKLKTEDDGSGKIEIKIKTREEGANNSGDNPSDDSSDRSSDLGHDSGLAEVEAKVMRSGQAYIKVEINDRKSSFYMDSSDRQDIINAVAEKYNFDPGLVGTVLKIEYEGSSDNSGQGDNNSSEEKDSEKFDNTDSFEEDFIYSQESSQEDLESMPSSDKKNGSTQGIDNNSNLKEVEVEVENGEDKVKVKIGEQENKFSMPYTDTDSLVNEIMSRFGLAKNSIEQVMKIEVKD